MKDRVPGKPGRVELRYDDGTKVQVTMTRADEPAEEGTPLCKATILPDNVCAALGLDSDSAEIKDAWLSMIRLSGNTALSIRVLWTDGTPMAGVKIEGLTGVNSELTYTNGDGFVTLLVEAKSYTLSVPSVSYFDTYIPAQSITLKTGEIQSITLRAVHRYAEGEIASITASQNIKFSKDISTVDVALIGGGGGGHGGSGGDGGFTNGYQRTGGKGGSGGSPGSSSSLLQQFGVSIKPDNFYAIVIGAGGTGGTGGSGGTYYNSKKSSTDTSSGATGSNGNVGGATTALEYSSAGGSGATGFSTSGGKGGSFNNAGVVVDSNGSNGSAGSAATSSAISIFNGDYIITRYAGGAGGAGGGGSGGGDTSSYYGGKGGNAGSFAGGTGGSAPGSGGGGASGSAGGSASSSGGSGGTGAAGTNGTFGGGGSGGGGGGGGNGENGNGGGGGRGGNGGSGIVYIRMHYSAEVIQ